MSPNVKWEIYFRILLITNLKNWQGDGDYFSLTSPMGNAMKTYLIGTMKLIIKYEQDQLHNICSLGDLQTILKGNVFLRNIFLYSKRKTRLCLEEFHILLNVTTITTKILDDNLIFLNKIYRLVPYFNMSKFLQ